MHMGVYKDYMKLYIILSPNHAFAYNIYRNPSLRLMTKVRACKGAGQRWSPGITFHAIKSVGECEGMNPHIPKWAPTLGKNPKDLGKNPKGLLNF
jgi:hypothetical protein